jgi:CRP/FNR family cyclic AMP-dependent transcriptional regulator
LTERAHILSLDPGFTDGIPPDELSAATRAVVGAVVRLKQGRVDPRQLGAGDGASALCVRGTLTQEVTLADRVSSQLLGPGDILQVGRGSESLVPHRLRWVANEPTTLAILGPRFEEAARRWPSLSSVVTQRLHDQVVRLSIHVAFSQLGHVELRLLALFCHLADRWGRVTLQGIAIPLRLTHEALGRLVGAQRPTVTLALMELSNAGSLTRAESGEWILDPEATTLLEPGSAKALQMPLVRPIQRVQPVVRELSDAGQR